MRGVDSREDSARAIDQIRREDAMSNEMSVFRSTLQGKTNWRMFEGPRILRHYVAMIVRGYASLYIPVE